MSPNLASNSATLNKLENIYIMTSKGVKSTDLKLDSQCPFSLLLKIDIPCCAIGIHPLHKGKSASLQIK